MVGVFTRIPAFLIAALAIGAVSCASPEPSAPAVPPTASGADAGTDAMKPTGQNLYADMKPVVSVKELMRDLLDPLADNIFDAISDVETDKGMVQVFPKTDADWDKIRIGAVALVEGSYLLRVKRPFAPEGDVNNSFGPEPMELSPTQIGEKIDKDPVVWLAKIEALRNVGLHALEVVKRRNTQELWDVSNNLDEACENCHLEYWYPGQKDLLDRLDRNLRDMYGKPGRTGQPAAK